jgi:hypothetical protein
MSRRVVQTVSVGLHRVLSLPVTLPLTQLKRELDRFQPQFINAYPSVAVLLAEEQLAGRLRIAPEAISTSSELRTPMMTARIQEAFGVRPFDLYGTTEGLWGAECEHHTGIHLFEDMTIVENVDEDGRPVPDGQPGARLLVTSLFNRTQPLIRLELADAVVLDPDRCPCGRTLRRIRSIHGRSDDVLELPGTGAATVSVHPLQFAVVARDRDVVEFQVVQEGSRLRVLVVARGEAPTLEARLRGAVEQRLRELGVAEPVIQVERRDCGTAPAGRQAPAHRGRPQRPPDGGAISSSTALARNNAPHPTWECSGPPSPEPPAAMHDNEGGTMCRTSPSPLTAAAVVARDPHAAPRRRALQRACPTPAPGRAYVPWGRAPNARTRLRPAPRPRRPRAPSRYARSAAPPRAGRSSPTTSRALSAETTGDRG